MRPAVVAVLSAILKNPDEFSAYLVYADALDEEGPPQSIMADGFRALGLWERRPYANKSHLIGGDPAWVWYGPMVGIVPRDAADSLHSDWLALAPELPHPGRPLWLQPKRHPPIGWRLYPSLRAALNAAALGFSRLPAQRRAGLLAEQFNH